VICLSSRHLIENKR